MKCELCDNVGDKPEMVCVTHKNASSYYCSPCFDEGLWGECDIQSENERLSKVIDEIEQHIDASSGSPTDVCARFRTIGRIIKQATAEKARQE